MNGISSLQVAGWNFNCSRTNIEFTPDLQHMGFEFLHQWSKFFPQEDTWVRNNLGVPSIIVRLDCVADCGILKLYEVEERPGGVGLAQILNPSFAVHLNEVRSTWPDFSVVVSGARHSVDDHLWATIAESQPEGLVLVRAEPNEHEFHGFEQRSVSSLREKGNKAYGVDMLLWTEVTTESYLPWESGFALKPKQGSKARGIEIWDPCKRSGCSTKTRIERTLERYGSMYCQKLIQPMQTDNVEYPYLIFRVFYGWDIVVGRWRCLGGVWNARANLRVHGATDTLFGPLVAL